jgi:hypothetical protein
LPATICNDSVAGAQTLTKAGSPSSGPQCFLLPRRGGKLFGLPARAYAAMQQNRPLRARRLLPWMLLLVSHSLAAPRPIDAHANFSPVAENPLTGVNMATTVEPIRGLAKTAQPIREFAKKLAFRYTRLGAPEYPYIVEPVQLATFVNELDRVKPLPGSIVEIGVARGMTTRFLCEHLAASGRCAEPLYAIDTFESFRSHHVEFELKHRGKRAGEIWGFGYIDFEVWKKNFRPFQFVTAFKADCSAFDYSAIAPIKFVFLDVDLYLATKSALRQIYPHLAEGGVVMVDDVISPSRWDGAYQAYSEFCEEQGLPFERVGNKMGILRK